MILQLAFLEQMLVAAELAVRHAAGLHLAALHRQDDVAGAAIALDQMEFRADHLVDHGRHDAGRGADADAADQHLLLEQVFDVS